MSTVRMYANTLTAPLYRLQEELRALAGDLDGANDQMGSNSDQLLSLYEGSAAQAYQELMRAVQQALRAQSSSVITISTHLAGAANDLKTSASHAESGLTAGLTSLESMAGLVLSRLNPDDLIRDGGTAVHMVVNDIRDTLLDLGKHLAHLGTDAANAWNDATSLNLVGFAGDLAHGASDTAGAAVDSALLLEDAAALVASMTEVLVGWGWAVFNAIQDMLSRIAAAVEHAAAETVHLLEQAVQQVWQTLNTLEHLASQAIEQTWQTLERTLAQTWSVITWEFSPSSREMYSTPPSEIQSGEASTMAKLYANMIAPQYNDNGQGKGVTPIGITPATDQYGNPVLVVTLAGVDKAHVAQSNNIPEAIAAGDNQDTYYFEQVAQAIQQYLTEHHLPPNTEVIIAGHSLGGIIAQQLAGHEFHTRFNVSEIITYGSPYLIAPIPATTKRYMYAEPGDLVPHLSPIDWPGFGEHYVPGGPKSDTNLWNLNNHTDYPNSSVLQQTPTGITITGSTTYFSAQQPPVDTQIMRGAETGVGQFASGISSAWGDILHAPLVPFLH